jgi:hypothetical protein
LTVALRTRNRVAAIATRPNAVAATTCLIKVRTAGIIVAIEISLTVKSDRQFSA